MADNELIVVSSDINFDAALNALANLRKDQLKTKTQQVVSIDNIESSQETMPFVFGGKNAENPILNFTRTAHSVIRLCMMQSANMQYVPVFEGKMRNKTKIQSASFGEKFSLGRRDKVATKRYYSCFDQLHPHFLLEYQYEAALPTRWWTMKPTMMLIFQDNFTKVIEFSTTFSAGERPKIHPGTFKSYVNVRCIVREILLPLKDKDSFKACITGANSHFEKAQEEYLLSAPNETDIKEPKEVDEEADQATEIKSTSPAEATEIKSTSPAEAKATEIKSTIPVAEIDSIIDILAKQNINN